MGIIAFGTGIGGLGAYGAMLCLIHHSLIKSALFLTSGNILLGYGSRLIEKTGNLASRMPRTFVAFFGGFIGIAGFPPFGLFLGELLIIVAAFRSGHYVLASVFIFSLVVIFAGFSRHVMSISYATAPEQEQPPEDKLSMVWPQYVLLTTSIVLCVWMPDTLYQTILNAVGLPAGGL